ncbi:MAG: helix-turn-helix domain-containing protein [Thermoplasmata archaeon]|nr:MAG: helix-turn-helix domain-containing protein [Thermoplasmata archaeon]
MMAELDLDTALSVLSNPMRREILSRLVMETHYPLQLAKELNTSQQAVMKHLGVLEKHGLVRSVKEPSDAGGPPRNAYTATQQLSIRIDIGRNLFNAKLRTYDPEDEPPILDDYAYINDKYDAIRGMEDDHERLKGLAETLRDVNRELADLERRRGALLVAKERLLGEANDLISRLSTDYDERRVLYYITDKGTVSVSVVSEHFNMREKAVEEIFFQLLRNRLLFDDRSLLLGAP